MKFDFSGYATKNNIKCSDGRTILPDAFKHNDGIKVPLVWKHLHDEPSNILGHAILENRADGVYAYGVFNDTPAGLNAKALVAHGDITALSIYANQLVQKAQDVVHGMIREVSLVMAGANPGAVIDNLAMAHGDGSISDLEDEAVISFGSPLVHEDKKPDADAKPGDEKTVQDVIDTMTEEQKTALYAVVASVSGVLDADPAEQDEKEVAHSDSKEGVKVMKQNVFEKKDPKETPSTVLTHDDFLAIVADAKNHGGSLREAFLAHAVTYGIENISLLFPDAKTLTTSPEFISRRMEWVNAVIGGSKHVPFSRIKSLHADITGDDARAKGYPTKAGLKKDEWFTLMSRTTNPCTIYKKQKLDRDDVIDITSMDVVAWLKAEMRVMLDEEIARAALISDGRAANSPDKVKEDCIRPIWTDADLYAHHVRLASDKETEDIIEAIIRSREVYNGSGSPTLFTTPEFLTDMLLVKDGEGRRVYRNMEELKAELRVSNIVEVGLMATCTRESDDQIPVTLQLKGIVVNMQDYTMGADKGGNVNSFEDFDIDYNQQKYLIETRCSGALTITKSAIVIEQEVAAG